MLIITYSMYDCGLRRDVGPEQRRKSRTACILRTDSLEPSQIWKNQAYALQCSMLVLIMSLPKTS